MCSLCSRISSAAIAALCLAAAPLQAGPPPVNGPESGRDYHSLANLAQMRVRHVDLYLDVDFAARRLSGVVDLKVERLDDNARQLVLDTRDLSIRKVWLLADGQPTQSLTFALGAPVGVLGQALAIDLPAGNRDQQFAVRISYQTRPEASGLQWLTAAQTAGKTDPFLYSQSEPIHVRSWIPLQDSPQARVTYKAEVHAPPGLRAVMSADNHPEMPADNVYRFEMPQHIPPYLIALAVGKLEFRAIGARTGVYAEPSVVTAAAWEFAETENMVKACENLFGPYRWGRYDMLILPPAFMFGGMENPRLSFITPTVLAGDRSLVALIAHELAHSWSGNLVSNATWRDFWLNEGFTVFLERRVLDVLYGDKRRDMEDTLGWQSLQRDLRTLPQPLTVLAVDLRGRDPDDGASDIPYEKGRFFLGWLQARFGRDELDQFLKGYFDHFAFQSIATEQFREYLSANLLARRPGLVTEEEIDEWLYAPGMPRNAVLPSSDAFARVDAARKQWLAGKLAAPALPVAAWSTFEWLHFLNNMPAKLPLSRMAELDSAFGLTGQRNAEIAHSWLLLAIRCDYQPAYPRLQEYLTSIGRRKLIKPLYVALMKTAAGSRFAARVYETARPGYYSVLQTTLDPIVRN
jgi:leukotriene-A4 hydrolase